MEVFQEFFAAQIWHVPPFRVQSRSHLPLPRSRIKFAVPAVPLARFGDPVDDPP